MQGSRGILDALFGVSKGEISVLVCLGAISSKETLVLACAAFSRMKLNFTWKNRVWRLDFNRFAFVTIFKKVWEHRRVYA